MISPQSNTSNEVYYQPGKIINQLDGYSYRKYIGQTADGDYILQDFYDASHKKMSDPFLVKFIAPLDYPYELSSYGCSEDVPYEGVYALYAENGVKKIEYLFKNEKITKVIIIDELALDPEDDAIFLDAENLAEGEIINYYNEYIVIYLKNILDQPIIRPVFDEHYNIVANGKVYDPSDYKAEVDSWSHAAYILFDIVNQQLSMSEYKFYGVGIDNELRGIFLTEKGYQYFQQKSCNKKIGSLDYPYMPTKDLVWRY